MDLTYLVVILALLSKRQTEERQQDPDAPKSTLAADKDSHGEPADA